MGVRIVKEPLVRMPGYELPAVSPNSIVGGCAVKLTTNPSQNEIQVYVTSGEVLGIALDGNVMPTFGSPRVGQQNVTEYNRGGLISVALGGGIYEVFRGPLDPADVSTAGALDTISATPYAVNNPIYAKITNDAVWVSGRSTGSLTATAGGKRIGRIINVQGSGESLKVQFIAEI